MEKEIQHVLETPIEYAKGGDLAQASFITLIAPSSKNITECAFLKQAFFRALPKDAEGEGTGKDEEIDADAIMMIIAMSPHVELANVMIAAKKLFTSGTAMVDGEEKLTVPLADKLSNDDLEQMIGKYLENFILASALRKLKKLLSN